MVEAVAREPVIAGAATGAVKTLLQLEGLALLIAATSAYAWVGAPWWLYAVLFLVPDIGLAGYLVRRRVGAIAYDALHVTFAPLVLGGLGVAYDIQLAVWVALIWLAHIGVDRALGIGLKYEAGAAYTHLGRMGRRAWPSAA
ncbi:MAG: DUF4260 domain-containing protein [Bauldia sp.]